MMNYLDFDLKIERENNKYKARIMSPGGEGSNTFTLPFSDEKLENLILKIGRLRGSTRRIHSDEMEAAREFGGKLFESVFSGDVNSCLKSSLDRTSQQEDLGLRLKLRLQEVPELANLPWEFLFNPPLNRFYAQSIHTPIVRYIEMPERIPPLNVQLPLRLLVMISSPVDYVNLDVNREKEKLKGALQSLNDQGKIYIKWLENATLDALRHSLREGYHIFHFIGHGGFDVDEGVLVFEDESNHSLLVGAHRIGTLLHDFRSLRLAVLNSCEGARNSKDDPFAGVAASLIQQGIPAVVAMQFEISDDAAIKFSGEFYDALAKGDPIDAAVSEARKAIYNMPNDVEWGTPVLYMRSPDGILFNIKKQDIVISTPSPEPISNILTMFKRAISVSDWNKAIELGEKIMKSDASNQLVHSETAKSYELRALNYTKKGEFDNAIKDYNRAIELNPNIGEYFIERGKCYMRRSDYDHAIEDYNKALKLDPNNENYYWELGMGYANKHEYEEAIVNYNKAIQINPNKSDYFYSRGLTHANKGDIDPAINDFNRSIQLDPNKADYYWERGKCYVQKSDNDHAITNFNRAIELDSNKADYFFDRGKVYMMKLDFNRAIGNLNRTIQLVSDKADYYYTRGLCYANKAEHDKAIADYNRAIILDDKKAEYYLMCGKSYVHKSDYDRAVSSFNRAILLDPKKASYYFERGVSYTNRKENDKAIEDLNQSILLDPNKAIYYFELGYSYICKGDYKEAINNFNQSVKLDLNNSDYYYARCLCYASNGDYTKAIADFKQAIQLDPDKTNLLLHELRRQMQL